MARRTSTAKPASAQPPKWIKLQLMRLVDKAPAGPDWLHEIKYDGYRITRLWSMGRPSC
jgi:bifunctional non-homologous end joining protein LigD